MSGPYLSDTQSGQDDFSPQSQQQTQSLPFAVGRQSTPSHTTQHWGEQHWGDQYQAGAYPSSSGRHPTAVLPTVGPADAAWPLPVPPDNTAGAGRVVAVPRRRPEIASRSVRTRDGGVATSIVAAVVGLTGFAVCLFALPIEDRAGAVYFGNLRHAAAHPTAVYGGSSAAGRAVATFWWREGALLSVVVLTVLIALLAADLGHRRVVGGLVMATALGVGALLALAGYQTADLVRQSRRGQFVRESVHHFQLGYWGAGVCCLVVAVAGSIALSRRTG